MLLARKFYIKVEEWQAVYFKHMCYAASKLWNLCNYEKYHYKELRLNKFPDWYYQKKKWKSNFWYKLLPSQTAQEVCKVLDKSWKSYNALTKTKGIKNPKPPNNKVEPMIITYMQNGMQHNGDTVRLSLPITLKRIVKETTGISEDFIYLRHKVFSQVTNIKQLIIHPPENNQCKMVINYEVKEPKVLTDNGKYLAIDLGIHNLATCYDSANSRAFIVGREYLAINHYFHKEIAKVQSALAKQSQHTSKHLRNLYKKRNNSIRDYLHKLTKFIVDYCIKNKINTVVIGDLTGIRKDKKGNSSYNQKLYELPYEKIKTMLKYKLALASINFVLQNEAYTSQCSPTTPRVSKEYANKSNRVQRGLYFANGIIYNADAVGAYNILRKYCDECGIKKTFSNKGLSSIEVIKLNK